MGHIRKTLRSLPTRVALPDKLSHLPARSTFRSNKHCKLIKSTYISMFNLYLGV